LAENTLRDLDGDTDFRRDSRTGAREPIAECVRETGGPQHRGPALHTLRDIPPSGFACRSDGRGSVAHVAGSSLTVRLRYLETSVRPLWQRVAAGSPVAPPAADWRTGQTDLPWAGFLSADKNRPHGQ